MNYFSNFTLQHKVLVKITTILWNHEDIEGLLFKYYFPGFKNDQPVEWQDIERKVSEKASKFRIGRLKEEVLRLIKPIGLQIFHWMDYHVKDQRFGILFPKKLCWTEHGTIDKKKTAKLLIDDEHLNIKERYKLACIYCLEEDIQILWDKMPERQRKCFVNQDEPDRVSQEEIVVFWSGNEYAELHTLPDIIEEDLGRTLHEYVFIVAVFRGNAAATEYFFQKLTSEEKCKYLNRTASLAIRYRSRPPYDKYDFPPVCYSDVLDVLLAQMNEKEKITLFSSFPCRVLKCFLDWPRQYFFMDVAMVIFPVLSNKNFRNIVIIMVKMILRGENDYDYRGLFSEFWRKSPSTLKECLLNDARSRAKILSVLY